LSEKFGFNSIVKKTKNGNFECLVDKAENKFQVAFLICDYEEFFWTGTQVNFSGSNGAYFYRFVKRKQIDWDIFDFSCTKISRFYIHYFRKGKISDQKTSIDSFLTSCKEKIGKSSRIKHVSLKRNFNDLILRIIIIVSMKKKGV
jgi:hypothetical protein